MRPRTELVLAAALLLLLAVGAAALGARGAGTTDADSRRSTFLTGPDGAMAYAQALERLGVRVERWRGRPAGLTQVVGDSGRTLVAVLGPSEPLSVYEAKELAGLHADLLLAGGAAAAAIGCFGYDVLPLWWNEAVPATPRRNPAAAVVPSRDGVIKRDSVIRRDTVIKEIALRPDSSAVVPPGGRPGPAAPFVRTVLAPFRRRARPDAPKVNADSAIRCKGPTAVAADTLLRTADGRPAALRLHLTGGRQVILVSDDGLFANRALRHTDAGPFALGLAVPRYRRVLVDEYHHGFGTRGSFAGAVVAWSARSPWGWAAWQLSLVGVLALLAAGVRFGPVRSVIERRRRSPLEHVRALAAALAAARGHTVAVTLMVQGLRRRLSRAGRPVRGDPRAWLEDLAPAVRTDRGRRALDTLRELTGRPVDAEGVRRAAHAVEDVWEELKPS